MKWNVNAWAGIVGGQIIPSQAIDRGGKMIWPPQFLDLTLLNFYLWDHIKSIVYAGDNTSLE